MFVTFFSFDYPSIYDEFGSWILISTINRFTTYCKLLQWKVDTVNKYDSTVWKKSNYIVTNNILID